MIGVDLSPGDDRGGRRPPPGRARRAGSASRSPTPSALPFEDGGFDLVVLLNMIPFFAEIARVTAPGGAVAIVHGSGSSTPIWTPPKTLREGLAPFGFGDFEELAAGSGTALLARKRGRE